ncbi:MAG: hypothetical protein ICV79_10180 [Flavisolibacter sp.]|nr:hypothetical protein [Flavisolibacter sp.]
MADLSIINLDPQRTNRVRYALGQGNWSPFRIPDITREGEEIILSENQIIDVIILADGYQEQAAFESQLHTWIKDFYQLPVYEKFSGAFRIRALYVQSDEFCSSSRKSFYRVPVSTGDREEVTRGGWYKESGTDNERFRERLFASLEEFNFNTRVYPNNITAGDEIHNHLANLFSNLVVLMLVHTESDANISGRTVDVPDTRNGSVSLNKRVNVGLGAFSIHEFGHAFAYLDDEYISTRGSTSERSNPVKKSLFTLSNLSFSDRLEEALWLHISPWGRLPRQAAGNAPSPVVGWLWQGGENDLNVWHSEYHCLMNGTHKNYAFTPNEKEDPTGPDADRKQANLRWRNPPRYCLWCQEIVAARILEKTGQLLEENDPSDINKRGEVWYNRWTSTWRERYWNFFDVSAQIKEREALYANPGIEPESFIAIQKEDGSFLDVWRSELYKPFMAALQDNTSAPAFDDAEQVVLMNAFS